MNGIIRTFLTDLSVVNSGFIDECGSVFQTDGLCRLFSVRFWRTEPEHYTVVVEVLAMFSSVLDPCMAAELRSFGGSEKRFCSEPVGVLV